jgi:hypothetical protein
MQMHFAKMTDAMVGVTETGRERNIRKAKYKIVVQDLAA